MHCFIGNHGVIREHSVIRKYGAISGNRASRRQCRCTPRGTARPESGHAGPVLTPGALLVLWSFLGLTPPPSARLFLDLRPLLDSGPLLEPGRLRLRRALALTRGLTLASRLTLDNGLGGLGAEDRGGP